MEIFIGIAMVCIFIAGRKSARGRLTEVKNDTDYLISFKLDKKTGVLTVLGVEPVE